MNRISQARAIGILIAGFVAFHASTASATLMVRLTETTTPGNDVSITIEDNGIYDSDMTVGTILFTDFNGNMSFGGFNAFMGGNLNATSNLGSSTSTNEIWNLTLQTSTTSAGGSLLVEVSDVGYVNSWLASGDKAKFENSAELETLFAFGPGAGATATDIASFFTPGGTDFDTSGTPLSLNDLSMTDDDENSMVLTGPLGPFSLVTNYTINHTGMTGSTLSMSTAVVAPEPGSMLVWGGISLAGFAAYRRRRQKANA